MTDWVIKHRFFFHPTCYIIKQKCEHLLPLNKLTLLFQQFCVGLIFLMFSQTLLAHLATPCCVGKWWWSHMEVIYQTWDAVFYHQMKHQEESWKYDAQRSIFDELRGVSSGDETLCRMFDISSQTKSFLKEKLRMQILSSFSSDFQTLIKH